MSACESYRHIKKQLNKTLSLESRNGFKGKWHSLAGNTIDIAYSHSSADEAEDWLEKFGATKAATSGPASAWHYEDRVRILVVPDVDEAHRTKIEVHHLHNA